MIKLSVLIIAVSIGVCSAWPNFYFYSKQAIGTAVNVTNGLVGVAGFDQSKPTTFLIHGFGDSCKGIRIKALKDALVKNHDINMICVDWEKGAAMPWYWDAVDNTRIAGRTLAQFIINNGITGSKVHCIGHSLGGHTCGFAGKNFFTATYQKFSRISGLDPAGPWFWGNQANERLDKNDADFVDCIHTDGLLGIGESNCHKDYFPNGGKNQPGCGITSIFDWFGRKKRSSETITVEEATNSVQNEEDDNKVVYKISFAKPNQRFFGIDFGEVVACSHIRVLRFYEESAESSCRFTSTPCPSWSDFEKNRCGCDPLYGCPPKGFYAYTNKVPGNFYLQTNSKIPFCKG